MNQLETFFYPNSVAVIGASRTPGKIGHAILRNLDSEFNGKIWPINPKYDSIMDLTCYSSVTEVPEEVDVAVVALPSKLVPDLVEECGKTGIENIILISGGFKELGEKFANLSKETAKIAKKYGIRIIGPNCIGVFNPSNGFITFFQPRERIKIPRKGNVAILSQSGTNGISLLEWLAEDKVGVSKFVSYGNKLDVNEADLLSYLREDDETEVIGIYLEALGSGRGREFYEEAKKTAKEKPVVVLRGGSSDIAAKAALSHTGFLGGKQRIYQASFQQANIIESKDMETLFDMVKTLSKQPPTAGTNIAYVSNGAGPMVQAVDAVANSPIELAEFSKETKNVFKDKFPSFYVIKNPLDITGSATVEDYKIALNGFIEDDNVDIIGAFFVFQDSPLNNEEAVNLLKKIHAKARSAGKPILVGAAGGPHTKKVKKKIEETGIPTFPTAHRFMNGAECLINWAQRSMERET